MEDVEIAKALHDLIRPNGPITCGEANNWQRKLRRVGFPEHIVNYATWPTDVSGYAAEMGASKNTPSFKIHEPDSLKKVADFVKKTRRATCG